ncbi:MAG: hypothetical protein KatS3mg102_0500 [Planctomycetota bacterium]|nr:MAG: hypothetical protein KatS3mg102_0500 [Planctomycetota bacterium]
MQPLGAVHAVLPARLQARLRWLFAASGLVQAAAVLALLLALGLLVCRLAFGWAPLPRWWWLGALLPPALAWAGWRAWRHAPSRTACAAWLDRRLGLGGLLLSSAELGGAGGWQARLAAQLEQAPLAQAWPRLDGRSLLVRLAAPGALLGAVLLLPPPPAEPVLPPQAHAAMASALAELQEELARLRAEASLEPQTERELAEQLQQLQRALAAHSPPSWSEIDALGERIAHEQQLREQARQLALARLEALLAGPLAPASGSAPARHAAPGAGQEPTAAAGSPPAPGGTAAPERLPGEGLGAGGEASGTTGGDGARSEELRRAQAELARLLAEAERAGLLRELDPESRALLAELERLGGGPELADPAQLRAMAEALRQALARGAELPPFDPAALREALARARAAGGCELPAGVTPSAAPRPHPATAACAAGRCAACAAGSPPLPGSGGIGRSLPGSGGISRGPGSAPLGTAEGEPAPGAEGEAMVLPRPLAPPRGGVLLGTSRAEPETAPQRDTGAGGAGQADGGGAAATTSRLSPAHREAVRRYFREAAPPR